LAPTGLAAFNIGGQTVHRFFKLPVFKNSKYDKHWQLSDSAVKILRQLLPNLKLIICGINYQVIFINTLLLIKF